MSYLLTTARLGYHVTGLTLTLPSHGQGISIWYRGITNGTANSEGNTESPNRISTSVYVYA